MNELKTDIILSLSARDWDHAECLVLELGETLGDPAKARNIFRDEILPACAPDVVSDFWTHVMNAEQYAQLLEHMTMAATYCLDINGFTLGKDFSFGTSSDGIRQLYLKPGALSALKSHFSPGRFSTLRIIIADVPSNPN